jgi:creatinine amidohydrolase
MRIHDMTWMQVEQYLEGDDRCVLPLGSTEQHAYLSLGTDAILAEKVALDAAAPLGVPVYPALPFGVTPYFMAYPGTVTFQPETYERVLRDLVESCASLGFRRILMVNGHGGNATARPALERCVEGLGDVQLLWHDWWRGERTIEAVRAIDPVASHGSWMEGFPWTRVPSAQPPQDHKGAVDLADRASLTAAQLRERLGDGSFGGFYERPEVELEEIWRIGVEETRALLETGWAP